MESKKKYLEGKGNFISENRALVPMRKCQESASDSSGYWRKNQNQSWALGNAEALNRQYSDSSFTVLKEERKSIT